MRGISGRARVGALVLLVTALSGCGAVEDLRTSDFAKQDVGPIIDAAVAATEKIESMRITGPVWDHGADFFVDLWVNRAGDCHGTLRSGGTHMDLRRVDGTTWFKGDSGFFNIANQEGANQGREVPASLIDKISTRWVLLDKTPARTPIKKLCDLDLVFKGVKTTKVKEGDGAERGKESDLDGTRAVMLHESPGGAYTEKVWIASEAPHRIIKVSSDEARERYTLAFSAFDEELDVEKPAAEEIYTP